MNSNDTQVGGSHYKGTTYQHWDFVLSALDGRYLEGNITKYIARHRKKNGLQDLQKARHYLSKLIEEFSNGNVQSIDRLRGITWDKSPGTFCELNQILVTSPEGRIICGLTHWKSRRDLNDVAKILDELIEIESSNPIPEAGSGYVDQG